MKRSKLNWGLILLMGILACSLPISQNTSFEPEIEEPQPSLPQETEQPEARLEPSEVQPAIRIQPEDLNYLGAFRLPDTSDGLGWDYSGQGLTYYPDGDPQGIDDGFPGSLFGVGHDQQLYVSESAFLLLSFRVIWRI